MKKLFGYSAVAMGVALAASAPAQAAISIGFTPGNAVYAGPTPTFDFDANTPAFSGGNVITVGSQDGLYARPLGSTGNYFSVGPSTSSPADITIGNTGGILTLSFIWGSVDDYNDLEIFDGSNNLLFAYNGASYIASNGNQTQPLSNPIATLTFTGSDRQNAAIMRLRSSTNAFEIDNISIAAVPEPGAWAMMILGFGLVGGALRRRTRAAIGSRKLTFAS